MNGNSKVSESDGGGGLETSGRFRKSNRCWLVLAGCCISAAVGFTIPVTCYTVFVTPMINDIGINYTQANMYITVMTLASVAVSLLSDRIMKLGAGKIIAVSGAITSVAFLLLAAMPSAMMIIVAGVLNGLAYPMVSLISGPVVIKNWFRKNEGTFVGICLAFIGVGGVFFAPFTTSMVAVYGWQQAMILLSVINLIVQVIVGGFMVRLSPIPLGILPWGATEEDVLSVADSDARGEDPDKLPGLKFGEVIKTPAAWIMFVCFLGLAFMATVTTNLNPMVQKMGFAAGAAGIVLAFSSIGNITGKLIMGWARDKRGSGAATLVGGVMAAIGFVGYIACFTAFPSVPLLCASAFICGNGCCMATMMPPLLSLDAFGPKDYPRVYGVYFAVRAFLAAVCSIIVGRMVDATGSYMSTVVVWLFAAVLLIPIAYTALRLGQKKWKRGDTKSAAEQAA